jgi:hypothetical protein
MAARPPIALLALALAATPAAAQRRHNPYDQLYGSPLDVPLADLAQGTIPFEGRPVRTRGRVDVYFRPGAALSPGSRSYVLRDGGYAILLLPRPEISANWEFEAQGLLGRRLEVTGHYRTTTDEGGLGPSGVLDFWRFVPDGGASGRRPEARPVTLERLLERPDRWEGRLVTVAGEFRGRNLFGDLSSSTQRAARDWVLKDGPYAAWVTGKPPRGDGFRLDPELRRDSGKWLQVVGRVELEKETVYVKASSVRLARRPVREVEVPPQPPAPEKPPQPGRVVFSLPLDGEAGIPRDSRFVVQFSKDMDPATFAGRVALRYAGAPQAGDSGFGQVSTSYDAGLRALTVDPGVALQPGRIVELLLLPGIQDLDGLALAARSGKSVERAAEILRFSVAP